METKYLYLFIDFLTILFPFLFSFYAKANFSKKWKYLWPAIVVPAVIFILWDEVFTQMGVWGFNEQYVSGLYVVSLPIEELLFFICIPYACVFTYDAFDYLLENDFLGDYQKYISGVLIMGSLIIGFSNFDKWYTATTFIAMGMYILYLQFVRKVLFLGRFYFSYTILLVPFSVVNGILTGSLTVSPVVWYNNAENLGIRIGTIPVEDIFYGMLLVLLNVSIFEYLQLKSAGNEEVELTIQQKENPSSRS